MNLPAPKPAHGVQVILIQEDIHNEFLQNT